MKRVVVVGAGIGGLSAAAILASAGVDVTVLEAHVYPGGCAGTFFHKGYRFDAGATLAGGFYPGGPMDLLAQAAGVRGWPAHQVDPAMVVHLPRGASINVWSDDRRWQERRNAFGADAERFWQWQERVADAMWDLASSMPPWPPQSPREVLSLAQKGVAWLGRDLGRRLNARLAADAVRTVGAHLPQTSDQLRLFVDAQLLIAAQVISARANALYGAAALDLPRRGVAHLEGGMGTVARTLVDAAVRSGAEVLFRQQVNRIVLEQGRVVAVQTKRGAAFDADAVIVNVPPWNTARLLADQAPQWLKQLPAWPRDGWGAFTIYVGLDGSAVPPTLPMHHQVITREPLSEGNSVFLSLSPAWDASRAPRGRRALTVSTHTRFQSWWQLFDKDGSAYEAQKAAYTDRILAAAEVALPSLREAADLVLPGTPITFERFTRRAWGWVGGFPQTHLLRVRGPRLAPGLWMVGDSVFPGQSVAAAALGGLGVGHAVLAEAEAPPARRRSRPHRCPQSDTYSRGGVAGT